MIDKKILIVLGISSVIAFLIYRQLKLVSKLTADVGSLTKRVLELENNNTKHVLTPQAPQQFERQIKIDSSLVKEVEEEEVEVPYQKEEVQNQELVQEEDYQQDEEQEQEQDEEPQIAEENNEKETSSDLHASGEESQTHDLKENTVTEKEEMNSNLENEFDEMLDNDDIPENLKMEIDNMIEVENKLSPENLAKLSLKELQSIARERNIKIKGKKTELIERISQLE